MEDLIIRNNVNRELQIMRTLAGPVLAMTTLVSMSAAAAQFDGNWIGIIPPSGSACRSVATMTITVSGDSLSGIVHNRTNVRSFTGSVDAEGNATFKTQYNYSGTIKFTAEHFDANWNSGDCQRHSLGDRAPDSAQSAALLSQRKQFQDTYDELAARAASGDRSVDFGALRAAYPFTRQWDAYGQTIAPLLEQANAAAKGQDCPTALQKIDEVLRVDYTVIAAHRVRSDCLKGDSARIESRIADGLMGSLKNSGNGKAEKTAYAVMSLHEEKDLLVDNHIVLKTRDTEVRGSNGRFYDVVHGISLWNGVRVQDVYFDVTAQVDGRTSGLVAADAVASTLP